MNNNLTINKRMEIFNNNEFGELKTILIDNQIYFIGNEIAFKLGYGDGNSRSKSIKNAITTHVDKDDQIMLKYQDAKEIFGEYQNGDPSFKINSNGLKIINESGMYSLVLGSKLPTAKKFKKWVTSEVLPSLRKNGTYSITTQQSNNMVANLVQSTMTAILPVITEQMAKVTVQNQQQINQMAVLIHDQADIYDQDRERIKELVGFKTANTSRIVKDIKEKLSDKMGYKIMANNNIFKKVKKEVFKEFKVVKWEDIPVEKYNAVYAFVDTYIDDMNV